MNAQLSIFDISARKHKGNANSKAANAFIAPLKESLRGRVLELITAAGVDGLTCEEIAEELGMQVHSISGRCSELKAFDLVCTAPFTRTTRSGRNAAVLICKGETK